MAAVTRVYTFQGFNKRGEQPAIILNEEKVTTLADGTEVAQHLGSFAIVMNPDNPVHVAAYDAIKALAEHERVKREVILANSPVAPTPELPIE